MRQTMGLVLAFFLGIAGSAQEQAPEKDKGPDYFPLKPGTKWSYELNSAGQKVKLEYSGHEGRDDRGKAAGRARDLRQGDGHEH